MRALLRRLTTCRKGAIAVETAVVAPILALCVLALADFGMAVNERIKLASAARAGAQAAMSDATNTARITLMVQQAASLNVNQLSVGVSTACGCSDGTAITCGSTCANGANSQNYVTVNVSETYPLLLTYPGLGSTIALGTSATMRY
jgi:pilus assembly protein CpaE